MIYSEEEDKGLWSTLKPYFSLNYVCCHCQVMGEQEVNRINREMNHVRDNGVRNGADVTGVISMAGIKPREKTGEKPNASYKAQNGYQCATDRDTDICQSAHIRRLSRKTPVCSVCAGTYEKEDIDLKPMCNGSTNRITSNGVCANGGAVNGVTNGTVTNGSVADRICANGVADDGNADTADSLQVTAENFAQFVAKCLMLPHCDDVSQRRVLPSSGE